MNVFVCLDDIGGMTFNHRRLSRDRRLIGDLIETVGANRLFMSEYSAPLFEDCTETDRTVDAHYLDLAQAGDFCFVEQEALRDYTGKIEKIILYKWNRRYPATTFFDLSLENWTRCDCADFVGSSHEKITKEIYIK